MCPGFRKTEGCGLRSERPVFPVYTRSICPGFLAAAKRAHLRPGCTLEAFLVGRGSGAPRDLLEYILEFQHGGTAVRGFGSNSFPGLVLGCCRNVVV